MTIKACKECGNQVSSKADKCPNCGIQLKRHFGCGSGCLTIVLALFALGLISSRMKQHDAGSSNSQMSNQERADRARTKACSESLGAIRAAQDAVKRSLKAPSTAKFPSEFLQPDKDAIAVPEKDCGWIVQSYVDAQNSFGATIRSRWQVKLRLQGINNYNDPIWTIIDIRIE